MFPPPTKNRFVVLVQFIASDQVIVDIKATWVWNVLLVYDCLSYKFPVYDLPLFYPYLNIIEIVYCLTLDYTIRFIIYLTFNNI